MPARIPLNLNTLNSAARFLREDFGAYWAHPDKKPLARQASEFFDMWGAYRTFPYQYIKFDLYSREHADDYRSYVPNVIVDEYTFDINAAEQKPWLEDKLEFDRRARALGLPLLDIWAVIAVEQGGVVVRDMTDCPIELAALWARARESGSRALFMKPRWGTQGIASFKLDVTPDGFSRRGEAMDEPALSALLQGGGYDEFLVQDYFQQHPATAALNNACVNTLRIITLVTDDKAETTGAMFRTGPMDRDTDNWMTGGYAIGIDLATGQLAKLAKLKHNTGRTTPEARHNQTQVEFGSITIPFVPEAVALVCKAALGFAPIRVIGWDVAMGVNGPCLLEGNWMPGFQAIQQASGGLRDTAIVRELAAKLNWR